MYCLPFTDNLTESDALYLNNSLNILFFSAFVFLSFNFMEAIAQQLY